MTCRWRKLVGILVLAGVYALLAKLVQTIATANGNATIFWLPGGLALAALLMHGKQYWPGVYIGAVAAGLIANDPLWVCLLLALGNTLEALLAYRLLTRHSAFNLSLNSTHDFILLGLAGTLSSFVCAFIGPFALLITGYLSPQLLLGNVVHWWQADTLGIVLGTPLFLIWREAPCNRMDKQNAIIALLFLSAAFLVGQAVFLGWFQRYVGDLALGYWGFFFVVLAAVRFGRHGVSLLIGMFALQALQGAVADVGFFSGDLERTGMQNFWFYLLILSIIGYSLALTIEALQRTASLLRGSESKWHDLFTNMTNGFVLHEAIRGLDGQIIDFRFLEANPAFETMTGLSSSELAGKRFKERFPVTDIDWIDLFRRVAESGEPCFQENYSPKLDRWFSAYIYRSQPDRIVELLQDISPRKHLEFGLRQSEKKLANILDNVSAYIYLKDKDRRYLFVNRAVCDLFKVDINEIIGYGDDKFFDTATVDKLRSNDNRVLLNGETIKLEETNKVSATGREATYLTVKLPLRNEAGEVHSLCGISTDITERLQAEFALKESYNLLETVIEHLPIRVFWKDRDLRYVGCNTLFARDAGLNFPAEVIGRDDFQLSWCELAERIRNDDRQVIKSGSPKLVYEESLVIAKGKSLWIRTSKVPFFDVMGKVIGVLGIYEDITKQKLIEDELKLAASVYQNSSEAMTVTDAENRIIAVNPAFTQLTGYSFDEVRGKNPNVLRSGRQSEEFYQAMWTSMNLTGHWEGEIWNRRKNGEEFAEWLIINTIYNDDGSVAKRVALFSDITEKKRSEALIWNQANFDPLTQLPNRRLFADRLVQEIKKAKRDRQRLAVLFLDLDRFKEVNDTLGHAMGDRLLVEAAQRIEHCVRETDTLARFGGDEFTVILSELSDAIDIKSVFQSIIEHLSKPFSLGDEIAYVSASIGVTIYPDDADNAESLLVNADQAMYSAKRQGRNRFCYFTRSMQEDAQERMRLSNDLHCARQKGQMEVYYQPIVELSSGTINKAEALIRWHHPELGLISPARFIPIAEESGAIGEIGDWVFQQAASQIKQWRDRHNVRFQISVNKSPAQFQSDERHEHPWTAYLDELGLSGDSIVVEITEGLLLNASEHITKKLLTFRDAGVQVAIDDFGTGYSSLAYLKKFDIDYLKIDKSFTCNLEPDSSDLVLSEAIVVMAHKLGLKVIAEGVETREQFELLKAIGCDYGQGYLFSKPLPADQFELLLEQQFPV